MEFKTLRPLRVYICDLTHDSIVLVSDTIPINIGFIASYAKKIFASDIDVSLFKYPRSVLDAIDTKPPDVIAFSNYSWNSNLSEHVAWYAKQANRNVITVQGGTNFPHEADQQLSYLCGRPATDFHTVFEGEVAFANIVERILAVPGDSPELFDEPIDGVVFIEPSTRASVAPVLITGVQPPRLRELDEIPSPYLSGLLDTFFDGRLTPFIESNRGCPFKCTFCHTGSDYFQKINMFSTERIREEIFYIAPRMAERGIVNLHIADTNFGMFPRDREICEALYDAKVKFGWPLQIMASTGKNNKERVIDITGILGDVFSVWMSVQSMDENVLSNVKRSNIKLDHYVTINKHMQEQGRATKGELIIGLPGETRESFFRGLEKVIEAGVSSITIYTLMLLHGTEFRSPAYREKHGIKGRYRIVPLNFGTYRRKKIFDYEEVCVENNYMSFDDYLYLRRFALLVETLLNGRPFDEFFRFVVSLGVSRTEFLQQVCDKLDSAPKAVRDVLAGFMAETQEELWESETDLLEHYKLKKNYDLLIAGEVGGNLIYKYKSMGIGFAASEWIDFLAEEARVIVDRMTSGSEAEKARLELECLTNFCRNKTAGLLNPDADVKPIDASYLFDVAAWLRGDEGDKLSLFSSNQPIEYTFAYSDQQLQTRTDQFTRYGTDVNALSKIVTRIGNLESQFRKILHRDGAEEIYADLESDRFTRYGLSH